MLLGYIFHILGAAYKKQLLQAFLEVNIHALLNCNISVKRDLLLSLNINASIQSFGCTHSKY